MAHRLLGVTQSRGDPLQRQRSRKAYLAEDGKDIDIAGGAMTGEASFHDALSDPRPAAAEHESHFVERCATQVEGEDPSLELLAIQT